MVRKNLMDIVTLSGIRKELLLYLDDGPRSLAEIRERFDITSPEVSPRIKELIEHHLIKFEAKKYHLTTVGKIVVKNFKPFMYTNDLFDKFFDYFCTHNLDVIPDHLLYRLYELHNSVYIEDEANDMSRTEKELMRLLENAQWILGATPVFKDSFPELFLTEAQKNKPVSIVVNKSIYNKLKKDYPYFIDNFPQYSNSNLYVSNNDIGIAYIVTNELLFFSSYYNNGKYDFQGNLVSNDITAIKWGRDLFEYYQSNAIKIKY